MGRVGFVRNMLAHVEKKPFGAGTKQYVAQLALTSVCYFYLLRTFIDWSNEAQAFKARMLWRFSSFFLKNTHMRSSRGCRKVLPPWPHDSQL